MLTYFLSTLAYIISIASILIIAYGVIVCIIQFFRNELGRISQKFSKKNLQRMRIDLSAYLLLGLEFLIASDIIETVLKPGKEELILLGVMVVLRTVLSVFLNKEIKEIVQDEDNANPVK